MFTRASLIGAELKATAGEAGKGTRLELRLPLAVVERETVRTEAAQ
jgi:hypothetical protein